jgi:hypothetical protein
MGLVACESAPPPPQFPELTFTHLPPIKLDVARIDVVRQYVSPGVKPNVEQLFPVLPAAVAERWAHDRLRAVGGDGVARVIIQRASVVEAKLPRTTGLQGMFTTDQAWRYDGVLEVSIEVLDRTDGRHGSVSVRAMRSRTAPENVTLNDRDKLWFDLTEALINDVNASLERQIKEDFRPFLAS